MVRVVVGNSGRFERPWFAPFMGQEREAVEVTYHDSTFYLDNEGYEEDADAYEHTRAMALSFSKSVSGRVSEDQALIDFGVKPKAEDGSHLKVGYPGWGWAKVTAGGGGPNAGHASLDVERVVE